MTALHVLIFKIENTISQKEYAIAFLDMEGAFNNFRNNFSNKHHNQRPDDSYGR